MAGTESVTVTYQQFIQDILNSRGRFGLAECYKERHHIIPKCQGGSDDKDNLIDLLPQEHYEAHHLLALENPQHAGLQAAWVCMTSPKQNGQVVRNVIISKEQYAEARIALAKAMTGEGNPCYGRKHTEEEKELMRKNHCHLYKEDNSFYGKHHSEETKKRLSELHKGIPWSEERKQQRRNNYTKEKHPNYGKHLKEETCKKIGEAQKGEKSYNFGKHWYVTLDGTKEDRFYECPEGWKPGRKKRKIKDK